MGKKHIYKVMRVTVTVAMLLFCLPMLFAQQRPVTVNGAVAELRDDSVHISCTFCFNGVALNSTRKLVMTPFLRKGPKELKLPAMIVTGKRRRLDDRRMWEVDPDTRPRPFPHTIIEALPRRKAWTGKHRYQASVPYASWMRDAELVLEEREMDCCDNWLLALTYIDDNIDLPDPCGDRLPPAAPDTVQVAEVQEEPVIPVEPAEVPLCVECTVIYIEFVVNKYDIRPDFRNNRMELAKVDSVIAHLPKEECTLHVCGYASPEGILLDNEILARNRTESFARYLKRTYRLPARCTIETTSVGEDWEGLVKLLKQTGKPYAPPALDIIESFGVLDGRERRLMELERGDPYRDMLETLFPYLRRIELRVRLKAGGRESGGEN